MEIDHATGHVGELFVLPEYLFYLHDTFDALFSHRNNVCNELHARFLPFCLFVSFFFHRRVPRPVFHTINEIIFLVG